MNSATAKPVPTPPQVEWMLLANEGDLYFCRSPHEFAVYTRTTSYGRWPVSEEGYKSATKMYEAISWSYASDSKPKT